MSVLGNDTGKKRIRPKKPKSGPKKRPVDKKPVRAYKQGGGRKNLPTDQTGRSMSARDRKPAKFKPTPAGSSKIAREMRPPRLIWERETGEYTLAGPLYIHEKHHPSAFAHSLKRDHEQSLERFFKSYDEIPKGAEFEWYQHTGRWQNRIIRGESSKVMASLLAKEGLIGKVQMVYFDPPYGIDFRKILQANVDREKNAGEVPNDPIAIQTFRDTYKNGIHSYLDNIYRIASHARDMLTDSGSFFLQISSVNVNMVAAILDEIFNPENRMGMISVSKTSASSATGLPDVADYLLWYAKDKTQIKYHQIYEPLKNRKEILKIMSFAAMLELDNGKSRNLTPGEKADPDNQIPKNARLFQRVSLMSQGYSKTGSDDYEWDKKTWKCLKNTHWRVSKDGLDKLAEKNRLIGGTTLRWKKYENEIPGRKINNVWGVQESARDLHYVVETAEKTIEKCILMTTDPGDLVLDPTCGSGTTAFVAEKWGRRWITSDMGLVAVNLARQRLLTGIFKWYTLIDSEQGFQLENEFRKKAQQASLTKPASFCEDPAQGFVVKRIPHVSAKLLAYPDLELKIDYIVNEPESDRGRVRVSSPFTVESHSPYRYVGPKETFKQKRTSTRQNIVNALKNTGIRINDKNVKLMGLEEYPGKVITHIATIDGKKTCVLIANDDCTIPPLMVDHAFEEASTMPSVTELIIIAFSYEPSVRNEKRGRLNIYKMMANQDLQLGNLRDGKDDVAFVRVGEPDIRIVVTDNMMTAEVLGYDTFNPSSGNTERGEGDDVYCWMIDTDYDGRSFFARRLHFPGSEGDKQVKRFHKRLERHIDQDLWDSMLSLKSAPFPVPKSGRIAVKIITTSHSEMTAEIDVIKTL